MQLHLMATPLLHQFKESQTQRQNITDMTLVLRTGHVHLKIITLCNEKKEKKEEKGKEIGILRGSLKLFKVHNSIIILYIVHDL